MSVHNLLHNLQAGLGVRQVPRHHFGNLMGLPNPQNPGGLGAGGVFPNPRAQRGQMMGRGVAWGGQNFQTPEALAAWINAHGGHTSAAQFMHNHPGAFGRPAMHVNGHQMGEQVDFGAPAPYVGGGGPPDLLGPPVPAPGPMLEGPPFQGGMQGALMAVRRAPRRPPPLYGSLMHHRRPRRQHAYQV